MDKWDNADSLNVHAFHLKGKNCPALKLNTALATGET